MNERKLALDPVEVRRARSLARKVGSPIVQLAKRHTPTSVGRATLRMAGLSGADAEGTPWVNRLTDVVRADTGLEHGVSLPVWDALVRGEAEDLATLAQKAAAGSGSATARRQQARSSNPNRGSRGNKGGNRRKR